MVTIASKVVLTPEQDQVLLTLKTSREVPAKTRLRAQAIHLYAQGWKVNQIAGHLNCSPSTIYLTLRRWSENGLEGLWDNQTHRCQQLVQLLLKERQKRELTQQQLRNTQQQLKDIETKFNTYLESDIKQRTWEYQILSTFSRELGYPCSYQDVFTSILPPLQTLVPYDVISVILLNPSTPTNITTGQLFWLTEHHLTEPLISSIQQNLRESLVYLTEKPLSADQVTTYQLPGTPSPTSERQIQGLGSHLMIPLFSNNSESVIGLIFVGREPPHQYSSETIHLMYQVSSYISILLEWFQSMIHLFENRYLETIVTQLPEGILLLNNDYKIILTNQTARQYLEILTCEIVAGEILRKLGGKTCQELMAKATSPETSLEMVSPLFPDRIFEVIIKLITLETKPSYWVILIRDISYRKQEEINIRNALEKEKELNALKSQVIRTVSHEYRTPLTQITLVAETLNLYHAKLSEEQRQKFLKQIQYSAKQMSQLVDDMLILNQVESGKLSFEPTALNILQFCQQLIEENQLICHQKHRIHLIHKGEATAQFDPSLVRQIFSNLLSNAIKYSPKGGMITVHVTISQGSMILKVKDQGIGIPKEDQPQLFESFHRGGNVGTIQGTGLGLAIVKKAIELHQGEIQFKSKVGNGTTFIVKLPC